MNVGGENDPTLREALWILEKISDPASIIQGLVANIPMQQGGAAVQAWLENLKGKSGGSIPAGLKGARQVVHAPSVSYPPSPAHTGEYRRQLLRHGVHLSTRLHLHSAKHRWTELHSGTAAQLHSGTVAHLHNSHKRSV